MDPKDPLNNSGPVGTGLGGGVDLSAGGTLTYDAASNSLFGYAVQGQHFFTIDPASGLALKIGKGVTPRFASVAGGACPGSAIQFKTGCSGGGKPIIPHLAMTGCPAVGNQVAIRITDGLGGSTALLLFGQAPASIPMGYGCNLLIQPLLPLILGIPLGGAGVGNGTATLPGIIPPGTSGFSFTSQAFVLDSVPLGGTATNGILVSIP